MLGQTGGEFDRSVVVIPVKLIAEDVFGRCNYVDTDRGLAVLVNCPVQRPCNIYGLYFYGPV